MSNNANIYSQHGRIFAPVDPTACVMHDNLPVGTYTVGSSPKGYYLEKISDFDLPAKLYGDFDTRADRILNTFLDRPNCTGVLLSGQKGSGKTMLTKRISEKARGNGIITIVINSALCGEAFNVFIASIAQRAIVIFDEFEKVYDRDEQQRLLTIFDGTYPTTKLFLLTCNDRYRVDEYMHNRPGRIYYAIDFGGLEPGFIREYCEDNLICKEHMNGVISCAATFSSFSFDMLKALVEEMNRYGETATQALFMLNMKPATDGCKYEITIMRNGKPVICRDSDGDVIAGSPLSHDGRRVILYAFDGDEEVIPKDGITEPEEYCIDTSKLIEIDKDSGAMTFGTHRPDTTMVCRRRLPKNTYIDYDAF